MTDYPEIKMCGADLPVLTTPQSSETPDKWWSSLITEAFTLKCTPEYLAWCRLREAEAENKRWKTAHVGWCAQMIKLGINSFRTLDEAIAKLAAERGREGMIWYTPCEKHQGAPWQITAMAIQGGIKQVCPICDPPLSAAEEKK